MSAKGILNIRSRPLCQKAAGFLCPRPSCFRWERWKGSLLNLGPGRCFGQSPLFHQRFREKHIGTAIERIEEAERIVVSVEELSAKAQEDVTHLPDEVTLQIVPAAEELLEKASCKLSGEYGWHFRLRTNHSACGAAQKRAGETLVEDGIHLGALTRIQKDEGDFSN